MQASLLASLRIPPDKDEGSLFLLLSGTLQPRCLYTYELSTSGGLHCHMRAIAHLCWSSARKESDQGAGHKASTFHCGKDEYFPVTIVRFPDAAVSVMSVFAS